nr:hypothetical protein [Paenibacillus humicola]
MKHFIHFVQGEYFWRLIKNTLVLSGLNLLFGFTIPILFALLLNEIRAATFKKTVQTASYMPYFISAVVVAGMVISFVNTDGIRFLYCSGWATKIIDWNLPPFHGFIRSRIFGKASALAAFCTYPRYHPSIRDSTNPPK